MEGILAFILKADLLQERDIEQVRRELGDRADEHLVWMLYSQLPFQIREWCRLATDDARAANLAALPRVFLQFIGFLDENARMPDDIKQHMKPLVEAWGD